MMNDITIDQALQQLQQAQNDPQAILVTIAQITCMQIHAELFPVLQVAAIPHWFDSNILMHLLKIDEPNAKKWLEQLKQLSIVEQYDKRPTWNVVESSRLALRATMASSECTRFRKLSAQCADYFVGDNTVERIQRIYHQLAISKTGVDQDLLTLFHDWGKTRSYDALHVLNQALRELIATRLLDSKLVDTVEKYIAESQKKICFVIMGYGMKHDFYNNRELNLNASYEHIIKPAVEDAGMKCIRADEIPHSGTIDVQMFNQLLEADLVFADLSTSNLNTVYELGVRHALKPRSTIIIADESFNNPFDTNHIAIRRYRHDGKILDATEAKRFREALKQDIVNIMQTNRNDSPVYTFLPDLNPPTKRNVEAPNASSEIIELSSAGAMLEEGVPNPPPEYVPEPMISLADLQHQADDYIMKKDYLQAKKTLERLRNLMPRQSQSTQQLALVTLTSEYPDKLTALREAANILQELQPLSSNNAETLALWGSVHKLLFGETRQREYLDQAITAFEKGYRLFNDYCNGINYAYLLDERSSETADKSSALADFILARRTREDILKLTETKIAELSEIKDVEDHDDLYYWLWATKAEAYAGLGKSKERLDCMKKAMDYDKNSNLTSTLQQITRLENLLENTPLKDFHLLVASI